MKRSKGNKMKAEVKITNKGGENNEIKEAKERNEGDERNEVKRVKETRERDERNEMKKGEGNKMKAKVKITK